MKKEKQFLVIILLGFFCAWIVSCHLTTSKPVALIVSAAGSYRNVLAEINELYKQENSNVLITYNIAGSGFLRQQIEQGAPVDIYMPAIALEMDRLQSLGLVLPETRQNLLRNQIVLILPKESTIPISKFEDLIDERIKRVAIGKETVATGIYTKQILTFLGIYEQVKKKGIVAEEDIRQVLKTVESKNADAGITFLTEAKLSNKVKIVAIAPANSHKPVILSIAVLKRCQNVPEAKAFIDFMKSEKAQYIFNKYGFSIVKQKV